MKTQGRPTTAENPDLCLKPRVVGSGSRCPLLSAWIQNYLKSGFGHESYKFSFKTGKRDGATRKSDEPQGETSEAGREALDGHRLGHLRPDGGGELCHRRRG